MKNQFSNELNENCKKNIKNNVDDNYNSIYKEINEQSKIILNNHLGKLEEFEKKEKMIFLK